MLQVKGRRLGMDFGRARVYSCRKPSQGMPASAAEARLAPPKRIAADGDHQPTRPGGANTTKKQKVDLTADQPRSGDMRKPGTSVPGKTSRKNRVPQGTTLLLRERFRRDNRVQPEMSAPTEPALSEVEGYKPKLAQPQRWLKQNDDSRRDDRFRIHSLFGGNFPKPPRNAAPFRPPSPTITAVIPPRATGSRSPTGRYTFPLRPK